MCQIALVVVSGASHHVIQRGNRSRPIFFCHEDYSVHIDLMACWCRKLRVSIRAYCLMWNHAHLDGSEDFAKKRMHARCVLTERGGMRMDAGLDRVSDDHMTDVMRMDDSLYGQRWSMLCEASELFRNDRSRFWAESERKGWVHAVVIKRMDEGRVE